MRAIKAGKHVYCEKPLAHSIHEVRAMVAAARQHKVVTQLGNQGHSSDTIRKFCEWVRAGAIGEVKELHGWCGSSYGRINQLPLLQQSHDVPATLDWNLWLGPVKERPYNPVYLPGSWRGWSAFGTGVVGDWTCHVIDPVFWAYDLGAPTSIVAETFDYDPKKHVETFPTKTIIRSEFPARGKRPAVALTWYDGGPRPDKPAEMGADEDLPKTGGLVIGTQGKITYGSHGAGKPQILPDERMDAFAKTPQQLPRSPGHHEEWIKACKEGGRCGSNFDYGGPLTEIALLGNIAIRFAGQKLLWDSTAMRITNLPEANQFINPPYRQGWTL
jgi:predicted dehydrogenase